jgi:hypothetical protein
MPQDSRKIWLELQGMFFEYLCRSTTPEFVSDAVSFLFKSATLTLTFQSGYGTNLGQFGFSFLRPLDVVIFTLPTEGPWTQVSQAIHDCHAAVHAMGAPRIATDIRIGTRTDREVAPGQANESKVRRVQEILAKST